METGWPHALPGYAPGYASALGSLTYTPQAVSQVFCGVLFDNPYAIELTCSVTVVPLHPDA
ncbi:hypothetical protein GCM10023166_31220 [Paeniglutamicibacter cryotolerans]